MTSNLLAYEEVADFIAALDPTKFLGLKPSSTLFKIPQKSLQLRFFQ